MDRLKKYTQGTQLSKHITEKKRQQKNLTE